MNYLFKQQSLKELVQYNRALLAFCLLLAASLCVLSFVLVSREEHWILIPATNTEAKMELSSKAFGETYLKAWGSYVMQTLMTTSFDTVEAQIDEIKVISSNSDALTDFFKKHKDFVKGSNIHCVFYPKKIVVMSETASSIEADRVIISGLFRYWLGSSTEVVSVEKTYWLTFKRGPKDVLLLKNVEEVVGEKI